MEGNSISTCVNKPCDDLRQTNKRIDDIILILQNCDDTYHICTDDKSIDELKIHFEESQRQQLKAFKESQNKQLGAFKDSQKRMFQMITGIQDELRKGQKNFNKIEKFMAKKNLTNGYTNEQIKKLEDKDNKLEEKIENKVSKEEKQDDKKSTDEKIDLLIASQNKFNSNVIKVLTITGSFITIVIAIIGLFVGS